MEPSELDLLKLYRHRFQEADRAAKERIWRIIVTEFFQQWIKPSDTVLDLGCGYGEFLRHVQAARRIGVDLNPDSRAALPAEIEFQQRRVNELDFLEPNSVDFVFTSNLLEHLPKTAIEQTVAAALRVLKPQGQFVAMGPNIRFLADVYWDFWDHVSPISDRSLTELLENTGYEVRDAIPRFLPYTTRSRIPQHPALVKLYLKCRFAWRFLGAQFLIRAIKP